MDKGRSHSEADRQMTMYHGCQVTAYTQLLIARVLGVLKHKIVVKCPLVGGGFGAKRTRNLHVVASAAIAANKLRKPVKIVLNRNVDMVNTFL